MSNTILLAVALQHCEEYSAHALAAREVAVALARNASKPLYVLSVYAYGSINTNGLLPEVAARYWDEQIQRLDACMQRKMAAYVAPLAATGVQVSQLLRVGNARDVVVQVATEVKADLLIMGSRGYRGLWDRALGSTAQQISRRAPCPVLFVAAKNDHGPAPICHWARLGEDR
jgi:nucleotide-binding universal stress UspA family protein